MSQTYTATQFFVAIIIAILLGGGAGYLAGQRAAPGPSSTSEDGGEDVTTTLDLTLAPTMGTNAIIAKDPQPAGDAVTISRVTLERDGWVAVHEDQDGKPGRILGARLFGAGATENGTVELLRGTVKGTYYAMIHSDDGDRVFDHTKDMPILEDGEPVFMKFQVE